MSVLKHIFLDCKLTSKAISLNWDIALMSGWGCAIGAGAGTDVGACPFTPCIWPLPFFCSLKDFACIGVIGVEGVGVGGGLSASDDGVAAVVEPFLLGRC